MSEPYIGRFAPSPTGLLHFGSLVAAVGSYLQARSRQGRWLVRIEDLDPPREQPGAVEHILTTLEQHGFQWDGPISYQSRRLELYQQALQQLTSKNLVYPCVCSRRTLSEMAQRGRYGLIYPGTCLMSYESTHGLTVRNWRVRTKDQQLVVIDKLQGPLQQNLAREVGDFPVQRADGYTAYQLAVVVDDAEQKISEVVRGYDLFSSTPRQVYLQTLLGLATPNYFHLPIVLGSRGGKLSKQTGAKMLPIQNRLHNLIKALVFLCQEPEPSLKYANIQEFWIWAIRHWNPDRLIGKKVGTEPTLPFSKDI